MSQPAFITTTSALTAPSNDAAVKRTRRYLGHKTADREPTITQSTLAGEPVLLVETFGRHGGASFIIEPDQWDRVSGERGSRWGRLRNDNKGYVASGRRAASRQPRHGGVVPVVILARLVSGATKGQHLRYANGNPLDLTLKNLEVIPNARKAR